MRNGGRGPASFGSGLEEKTEVTDDFTAAMMLDMADAVVGLGKRELCYCDAKGLMVRRLSVGEAE